MDKKLEVPKLIIDGVNLNYKHFGIMTKAEAVKAMKADGITKDDKWAEAAYEKAAALVAAK